jgi:hypothetical protein
VTVPVSNVDAGIAFCTSMLGVSFIADVPFGASTRSSSVQPAAGRAVARARASRRLACQRSLMVMVGVGWLALVSALAAHAASSGPLNLHTVRWADVTVPGKVCGAAGPIRLRDNRAVVSSKRWPPTPHVSVDAGWEPVVYGNLGDGVDAAGLAVDCSNGGGTADSVLAYAQVMFTAAGGSLKAIGVVTPQLPSRPGLNPPGLEVKIKLGEVIATEYSYGPKDATCCPSGRATTIWSYADGKLTPGKATVTKAVTR